MQRGSSWSPLGPSIQMKPTSAMTTAAIPRAISNSRQVAAVGSAPFLWVIAQSRAGRSVDGASPHRNIGSAPAPGLSPEEARARTDRYASARTGFSGAAMRGSYP